MDDAARVQRRERGQNLEADRDRLGHVQRTASQLVRQRLTLEQLHGDEQAAGVFADLVNLTDVGMVDAGRRARFTPQTLARRLVAGERRDRLQRDHALEALVARLVHHPHAALAELARDGVVPESRRRLPSFGVGGCGC